MRQSASRSIETGSCLLPTPSPVCRYATATKRSTEASKVPARTLITRQWLPAHQHPTFTQIRLRTAACSIHLRSAAATSGTVAVPPCTQLISSTIQNATTPPTARTTSTSTSSTQASDSLEQKLETLPWNEKHETYWKSGRKTSNQPMDWITWLLIFTTGVKSSSPFEKPVTNWRQPPEWSLINLHK